MLATQPVPAAGRLASVICLLRFSPIVGVSLILLWGSAPDIERRFLASKIIFGAAKESCLPACSRHLSIRGARVEPVCTVGTDQEQAAATLEIPVGGGRITLPSTSVGPDVASY